MTDGEKMVWAAVYASRYHEQMYHDTVEIEIPSICEDACHAVLYMRMALSGVEEGWNRESEEFKMLAEMIEFKFDY